MQTGVGSRNNGQEIWRKLEASLHFRWRVAVMAKSGWNLTVRTRRSRRSPSWSRVSLRTLSTSKRGFWRHPLPESEKRTQAGEAYSQKFEASARELNASITSQALKSLDHHQEKMYGFQCQSRPKKIHLQVIAEDWWCQGKVLFTHRQRSSRCRDEQRRGSVPSTFEKEIYASGCTSSEPHTYTTIRPNLYNVLIPTKYTLYVDSRTNPLAKNWCCPTEKIKTLSKQINSFSTKTDHEKSLTSESHDLLEESMSTLAFCLTCSVHLPQGWSLPSRGSSAPTWEHREILDIRG